MADFNRDERETETSSSLSKALSKVKRLILDALAVTVAIDAITSEVREEIETIYRAALTPELERTFIAAATSSIEAGVGISWDLVNIRAAEWANSYSFEVVKQIVNNDVRYLQKAIETFYRDNLTLGQLADKLTAYQYSPARAVSIAVTETTRAAVEADRLYVSELRKLGARMRGIVETNQDEKVCVVCGPKQGADVVDVGYPPFHVRCRCMVRYVNEV